MIVLYFRLSNVFGRFGRKWSFINWPRDLAHPSSNFHRGSKKSAKFGLIFYITRLWAARLKMQQYLKSGTAFVARLVYQLLQYVKYFAFLLWKYFFRCKYCFYFYL